VSKKSSIPNSTGGTRGYTTASSAPTKSLLQRVSPAYASGAPPYQINPRNASKSAYTSQVPTSAPQRPGPMLGGPVLPTISEPHRHADPVTIPHFRPLYSGSHGPSPPPRHAQSTDHSPPSTLKRQASQTALPDESSAKKQSKWTPEEDNLTIELRGQGMKWDDIAKRLPGRSSISCRLRYQNYLEKRAIWNEEKKNLLARVYARYVPAHTQDAQTASF
jgi:hypothetical protein